MTSSICPQENYPDSSTFIAFKNKAFSLFSDVLKCEMETRYSLPVGLVYMCNFNVQPYFVSLVWQYKTVESLLFFYFFF